MAQTELRIRDVWSSHPPLIGLPGRIGSFSRQGSHPGPISFWLLSPFYRLFGASAWAMDAAAVCLNLLVVGATLWLARRRGGVLLLARLRGGPRVLLSYYGPEILTLAWNPYMPVLWFLLFVLAVWSVLCDDWGLLPVVVLAGTFCAQTHISYVALVGGLVARWCSPGWCGASGRRPGRARRRTSGAGRDRGRRRRGRTWIPPVVQELNELRRATSRLLWRLLHRTRPSRRSAIRQGARRLPRAPQPVAPALAADAVTGVGGPRGSSSSARGSSVRWSAIRLPDPGADRTRRACSPDALVLGLLSIARIFGFVWYYLMLWAWDLNASDAPRDDRGPLDRGRAVARRPVPDASSTCGGRRAGGHRPSAYLTGLRGRRVDGRRRRRPGCRPPLGILVRADDPRDRRRATAPGGGRDGRYQVTIVDTMSINAPGYGLVSELERAGIHAGFPPHLLGDRAAPKRIVTKRRGDGGHPLRERQGHRRLWRCEAGARWRSPTSTCAPRPKRRGERACSPGPSRELRRRWPRRTSSTNLADNVFTTTFRPDVPTPVQRILLAVLDLGAAGVGVRRAGERGVGVTARPAIGPRGRVRARRTRPAGPLRVVALRRSRSLSRSCRSWLPRARAVLDHWQPDQRQRRHRGAYARRVQQSFPVPRLRVVGLERAAADREPSRAAAVHPPRARSRSSSVRTPDSRIGTATMNAAAIVIVGWAATAGGPGPTGGLLAASRRRDCSPGRWAAPCWSTLGTPRA